MKSELIVTDEWYAQVPRSTLAPNMIGILTLALSVFGFGVWAAVAPLDGAVVAPGTFVATGQNKVVQHLEGGIIREILVKEGDFVETGQVLVRLDPTDPDATLRRVALRQQRLIAMRARLSAEINMAGQISFPAKLMQMRGDPETAAIVAGQEKEFTARRDTMVNEIRIIEQGIAAIRESIAGAESQRQAVTGQLALINEELVGKRKLFEKGLVRKPELLALERARVGLEGQIGQLAGTMSDARERIAREEQKALQARTQLVQQATEQLRTVESELDDVSERLRVAEKTRGRMEITSPVRGIIIKQFYHTPGGVIGAGKEIAEILPMDEELVIEAKVRPQDIDSVFLGQRAVVRLTALNQRITPTVNGNVVYVSADALPDDRALRNGSPSTYVARVALPRTEIARVKEFRPTPGMPADIFLKTGERTFLNYLLKPLVNSFERAFRED